ncbi:MAG: sugar ABC transporter substrate-binding protein [Lachnospiraceae bacterium]|jgi:ABC-type sugar transport system substrate-binding protein|nr:sugar ABC transporter substrate-binding protein [Lachnospiraceae bacterium]
MKKLIAVVLIMAMSATLFAACKSADQTGASSGETSTDAAQETDEGSQAQDSDEIKPGETGYDLNGKSVGFGCPMLSVEFFASMSTEFEHFFTSRGAKYTALSADGNPATQVENIENFVSMGTDILILFLVDESAATDAMIKAREAGVYVVVVANIMKDPNSYDTCITVDQYESGEVGAKECAAWVDATFPDAEAGTIDVILLYTTSESGLLVRVEAMKTLAELTDKVKLYEYDLGAETSQDGAMEYAEQALMEHPDAKLIFCYGSVMALAADEVAMKQVTDKDHFAIIGIDSIDVVLDRIGKSTTNESLIRKSIKLGVGTPYTTFEIVTGEWAGELQDGVFHEECIVIDPSNYEEYYSAQFD